MIYELLNENNKLLIKYLFLNSMIKDKPLT